MAHTFRDIKVWEKAHKLVLEIYKITGKFPSHEKYGLTAQIRRSAASVPTNIAEGYKRKSDKDFLHFLNIADSSLEETKYHCNCSASRRISIIVRASSEAASRELLDSAFGLARRISSEYFYS